MGSTASCVTLDKEATPPLLLRVSLLNGDVGPSFELPFFFSAGDDVGVASTRTLLRDGAGDTTGLMGQSATHKPASKQAMGDLEPLLRTELSDAEARMGLRVWDGDASTSGDGKPP